MTISQKRIALFIIVLLAICLIAFLTIKISSGYKPDLAKRTFNPTGLLVATSIPDGASVYIDNKLKTATNNTLNLAPGEYEIEIKKDGFTSWKKKITIKKEVVTNIKAYLFSTYPDFKALTFTGASHPVFAPDEQKVAFAVSTASPTKRGLWILDLADRPLGLNSQPRQILANIAKWKDFSGATYLWSPDAKQLLVSVGKENYLIDASRLNPLNTLNDVTLSLSTIKKRWQAEEEAKQAAALVRLPEKLSLVLKETVKDLSFSPDETKIMYAATASATIPENIVPSLPSFSTQKESRTLEAEKIYVYDLKEDKNFYITDLPKTKDQSPKSVSWFPTSEHIFIVQNNKISIIDDDGTNWKDVYTGPFENSFAFSFPAGNRLLVLTSIGKDAPPNLYAITLR